jgi:CubicO group peptidase (beta-lactamase class C family)
VQRRFELASWGSVENIIVVSVMRRSPIWSAALVLVLACTPSRTPAVPVAVDARTTLLAAAADSLGREGFAGQIVVAVGGRIVLDTVVGFADSLNRTPVTRETLYDIASATKSFTAAAIVALRDEGRLRLDTPLGQIFAQVPSDKASITIEQLLAHEGGLATTYAADGAQRRDSAVQALLRQPLAAPLGSGFRYSDDGFVLLAAVVEAVSGAPYEEFLERTLLRRAGMEHTTFWGTRNLSDPRVAGVLQRPLADSLLRAQWGQRGSGGLLSTADDLFRWWQALTAGSVVNATSVNEMMSPRRRASGRGIGWGWFTTETPRLSRWTRGNEDFGHNALLVEYPQEHVVMATTSNKFKGEVPWTRLVGSEIERLMPKLTEVRTASP